MAKKDTYLALLRRGIDDTTAQQLADAGLKISDLKRIDESMLVENYGLKKDIAKGVVEIVKADLNPTVKRDIYPRFLLQKRRKKARLRKSNSKDSKRTS